MTMVAKVDFCPHCGPMSEPCRHMIRRHPLHGVTGTYLRDVGQIREWCRDCGHALTYRDERRASGCADCNYYGASPDIEPMEPVQPAPTSDTIAVGSRVQILVSPARGSEFMRHFNGMTGTVTGVRVCRFGEGMDYFIRPTQPRTDTDNPYGEFWWGDEYNEVRLLDS